MSSNKVVTFEASINWAVSNEGFELNALPPEFSQAKALFELKDERCFEVIASFINCYFIPSNIFGDIEEVFSFDNVDDEIPADNLSVFSLDFSEHNLPRFSAKAIFKLEVNSDFDLTDLDDWQDDNDMLDNGVSFEWEIDSIDEDADVKSLSHEGLEFVLLE